MRWTCWRYAANLAVSHCFLRSDAGLLPPRTRGPLVQACILNDKTGSAGGGGTWGSRLRIRAQSLGQTKSGAARQKSSVGFSLADDHLPFVRMEMICTIQVIGGALWLLPRQREAAGWQFALYSLAPLPATHVAIPTWLETGNFARKARYSYSASSGRALKALNDQCQPRTPVRLHMATPSRRPAAASPPLAPFQVPRPTKRPPPHRAFGH